MFIGGGGREAVSGRRKPVPGALYPAPCGRSRALSSYMPSAFGPGASLVLRAACSLLPGGRSEACGDESSAVHVGVPSFADPILAKA